MHRKIIKDYRTGKTLFEGDFSTLRECLEQAVTDHATLDGADLSGANLINASLDEAQMRNACFKNANLMGANLSEAALDSADFTNACLQSSCLCFSSLRGCHFEGAAFGATDIAGCDVSGSLFSTLSAFSLNFIDAENMVGCRYLHNNATCNFSRPPIFINGLPFAISLMDENVLTGSRLWRRKDIYALANDSWPAAIPGDACSSLYAFIRSYGSLLRNLPATRR
ncbi:MAG: pentapeptide repeat-containing protein [Proteobacteria bacterium]|nr:pentapeptide repeat-containing protein [Pseudomonadota bacterium]